MGYTSDTYNAAVAAVAARGVKARADAAERKTALCLLVPEYDKMEKSLSQTGAQLAAEIFRGGIGQPELSAIRERNLSIQRQMQDVLARNGLPQDYLQPRYACAKCGDSGFVQGRPCDCLLHEMRRICYDRLNRITPLAISTFETFTLEHYPETSEGDRSLSPRRIMEKTLARCRAYAREFSVDSPSLLFQGGVGLGKTHLSLAIAGEVIEKGFDVVYGSAFTLFAKIEREKFNRDQGDDDTLTLLNSCDLLILDDLGTEFITQFTVSVLYNIINTRLLADRPTIISTNLNIDGLEQKYSDRMVSRILGSYQRFPFAGKDLRITLRKARSTEHSG